MLTRTILPFLIAAAAIPGAGHDEKRTDIFALNKVISGFAYAWNKGDMNAFAELFDEDADFVVITGERLVGRAEIKSYHAKLNAQLYKGSQLIWTPSDVRFLRPDIALVHVSTEIRFHEGQDRRTSLAIVVLDKRGGRWRIASVQNTLTGGIPLRTPR